MHQLRLFNLEEINRVFRLIQETRSKTIQTASRQSFTPIMDASGPSSGVQGQIDIWIVDTDEVGGVMVDSDGLARMKKMSVNVPA